MSASVYPNNGSGNGKKDLKDSSPEREILLHVRDLKKYFPIMRGVIRHQVGAIRAVDGVSFDVYRGETLGLVGESGCGKSTTGLTVLRLHEPTAGEVDFQGKDLTKLNSKQLRMARRNMQIIFQDPYSSLDPRLTVERIISEPLIIHKIGTPQERRKRVQELLNLVGLDSHFMSRYPHEFSGGQRQRIGIARAIATNPELIVADEPISALDVSIQAQVVNLLSDLKQELGLTYLFIAHDLSMVRYISDRVAVMYLGQIVELSEKNEIYDHPLHPYTQTLLSAIPVPDPRLARSKERLRPRGEIPNPAHPPSACRFHTRCPFATELCAQVFPPLRNLGTEQKPHWVSCHYAEQFL